MFLETDVMDGIFEVSITILVVLIALVAAAASVMSIWLAIKYLKYNRQMVASNKKGHEVAKELLEKNDIKNIKVKRTSLLTSFMFGNSYSHYFKKIRLRGLIYDKPSLTSVALAGEKVGLAILDKEGDKDMKSRIRLTPIVDFGPFIFLGIVIIGIVIDVLVVLGTLGEYFGIATIIATVLGLLFYLWSFLLAFRTLKTEKKAQDKALVMLKKGNYLTDSEIKDAKELYKLYNINYLLSVIIALLELIKEVFKIAWQIYKGSKK